jgi:flagellar hook-length control protein FliK
VRVVLRPGMRHADVQLNPAELGRVSIRLALKGARVDAVARVESIEALAALERHLPELRAAFAERGIELGELDLQYTGDSPDTRDEARREAGRAVRFQRAAVQAGASSDPEPIRRRPDVATEDAVDTLA